MLTSLERFVFESAFSEKQIILLLNHKSFSSDDDKAIVKSLLIRILRSLLKFDLLFFGYVNNHQTFDRISLVNSLMHVDSLFETTFKTPSTFDKDTRYIIFSNDLVKIRQKVEILHLFTDDVNFSESRKEYLKISSHLDQVYRECIIPSLKPRYQEIPTLSNPVSLKLVKRTRTSLQFEVELYEYLEGFDDITFTYTYSYEKNIDLFNSEEITSGVSSFTKSFTIDSLTPGTGVTITVCPYGIESSGLTQSISTVNSLTYLNDWLNKPHSECISEIRKELTSLKHKIKILVFGPVGSGKTSFFNIMLSSFVGDILKEFGTVGSRIENESQTKYLNEISLKDTELTLADMFGFEKNMDKYITELRYIISGLADKNYYESDIFSQGADPNGNVLNLISSHLKRSTVDLNSVLDNAVHAALFFFPARDMDNEDHVTNAIRILEAIKTNMAENDEYTSVQLSTIEPIVVLTHADHVIDGFNFDTQMDELYDNLEVRKLVENAQQTFKVTRVIPFIGKTSSLFIPESQQFYAMLVLYQAIKAAKSRINNAFARIKEDNNL